MSGDKFVPFVAISIEGTTIGSTSDNSGSFKLTNIPEGDIVLKIQSMGYQPLTIPVKINKGEVKELNIELEEDILGLEEVVITGDRNAKNRKDASVIVNTLTPKLFNIANTVTLSEGLNFSPGLRMENNCQNCGFSQVRMNGMEGPYSQVLINGRAIFSGLAGVYGLELIPANMMERIEVVRGGGSALYGSNAIAGTINLILKDPINDIFEIGYTNEINGIGINGAGKPAIGNSVNANVSMVTDDNSSGMVLYGFYRNRDPFDANGDSFSELTQLDNTTFGSRIFHRFGDRNKFTVDFFNIKESRRGGDKFEYPLHESYIAEAVDHNILTGALTYEQYFRSTDLLSVYISGQGVERDSYYGAEQSLKDYGKTVGNTYVIGSQYNANFLKSNLTIGVEGRFESLIDKKLAYPDIENAIILNDSITKIPHTDNTVVADQSSNTLGVFAQYEYQFRNLDISFGGRLDNYTISDITNNNEDKTGIVFSPRVTLKYDLFDELQARVSYSKGYRAPQIFDEDLHIETSGSRKVLHENNPDLTQETSHSCMASLDFDKEINGQFLELLIEGFYTKLNNAFVNEVGQPNQLGEVITIRKNADGGAVVTGFNLELNYVPNRKFAFKSGFTIQKSEYEETHDFGENKFFRTPNNYGFLTIDWKPLSNLGISSTGNYTGSMLVPYYGINIANSETGELRTSESFFDWSIKVRYDIELKGTTMQVFGGMKNISNSYQDDFDYGIERDPGYVYGPGLPRTIYLGVKFGNFIK